MKLIMAVLNDSDVSRVAAALTSAGYPATVTESYGGFLGKKNSILFSGVEEKRVTAVIELLKQNTDCVEVEPDSDAQGVEGYTLPPQVRVGGKVFVLDVDRFISL